MSTDRLARLLGGDDLEWLVQRVRRRLTRGEPLDGTVTLARSTPAQRAAIHRLLGRRPRDGAALTVSLPAVDEVLRRSGASPDGLEPAVIALLGPIEDNSALAEAWLSALSDLPETVPSGLVRRLADTPSTAATLVAQLVTVVRELPSSGEPLGRFAARTTGDAHALDDDRPLATLVLTAARAMSGMPVDTPRREVWAAVGIVRDDLSTTVLTFALPGDPATPTGQALDIWRAAGQPVVLTLRQLVQTPPRLSLAGQTISVCENPVVLSVAADRLGSACAPLVCTNGQPGTAVMRLLHLLADSGAHLRYHGDFDWGGLRIANLIFRRLPATPWRFDTAAYVEAQTGRALTGTPADATWDPALAPAMTTRDLAVEEEHVLEELLNDLTA
jgi:uncharacterized protein (TIGR02679 family)